MQANSHYGLVADCRDCDGQLIEEHRTWPDDRVHVGLLCHDCGHSATVEWVQGVDVPIDAETSEPLDDLQVREIQWIDCRTCHGAGTVPEWGIRSGRRSCPNCFRSGTVPRLPATDGGLSVDDTDLCEDVQECPECGAGGIKQRSVGKECVCLGCNERYTRTGGDQQ